MKIAVTGIDGSGKTTVSRILASMLGSKSRVVWTKSLHTLAYLIYVLFRWAWGVEYIINPSGKIVEHLTTAWMKKLGWLWGWIELISLAPWLVVSWIYERLGYTVVHDRYLPDFLATVTLRTGNIYWPWTAIPGRVALRLAQKSATSLLDISLETTIKRRVDVEYTTRELKQIMILYKIIAKQIKATMINTSHRKPKETARLIIQSIQNR